MTPLAKLWIVCGVFVALAGCGGSGGASSQGEKVLAILKQAMPEAQAREEVRKFEEQLAKKTPQYDRERAWNGFLADAQERVKKLRAQNVAVRKAKEAEDARFVGAEERWQRWLDSGAAKGHLLQQLLKMRNLGAKRLETITVDKFDGQNMYFATKDGLRITAIAYDKLAGKPLTGLSISLVGDEKFEKASALDRLGLPKSEFRPVSISWDKAGLYWRWNKLTKPLGYGEDLGGDAKSILVFWKGS